VRKKAYERPFIREIDIINVPFLLQHIDPDDEEEEKEACIRDPWEEAIEDADD